MSRPIYVSMAQNSVLIEKCAKAKERLLIKMATSLQEDMARMLDEKLHSDLLIASDKTTILCHHMMLKCRVSSSLHKRMYSSRVADNHYQLQNVKISDLKTFISQLYTTEYIDVLEDEYTNILFPQQTSIQTHIDLSQSSTEIPVDLRTSKQQDINLTDNALIGCDNNAQEFNNTNSDLASHNELSGNQINVNGQRETTLTTSTTAGIDVKHQNSQHSTLCDQNDSLTEDILKTQECTVDNALLHSLNLTIEEKSNTTVTSSPDKQSAATNKDTITDNHGPSNSRSVPYDVCSQLGRDLLRALMQDVDSDCVLSASGKDFKCHKCVLAARSQYFSAMLSGAWLENEFDRISLDSVSPGVLEQALLYMYGGVVDLLRSCDLAELIRTADMLALDGLRDVAIYNIQTLCHLFHKPCAQCLASVPDALNLSVCYNLPDMKDKCIKWITKNILKVWPTKSFSGLPDGVLDLCCSSAINDMTADSVIGVIMDCDRLGGAMPRVKWSEPVMALNTRLMDSAIEFTSKHFTDVISSKQFIALGQDCSWGISLLDGIFRTVIKSLPVESACKTYLALHTLNVNCQSEICILSDDFKEFVGSLFVKCESYMKVYVQQVANSRDWPLLTKDMQAQILQAGSFIGFDNTSRGKGVPPKLTSQQKKAPAHIINALRESLTLYDIKSKKLSRWSPDREARAPKARGKSARSHNTDNSRNKTKADTSDNKATKTHPFSSAASCDERKNNVKQALVGHEPGREFTANKIISKLISTKDCLSVDSTEPSRKFKVKKIPIELKSKGPMKAVPLKDVCVESQGDTQASNNENSPPTRMRARSSSFGFSPTRPEASRMRRNSEGSSWSSQRAGSTIAGSLSFSSESYDWQPEDVGFSSRRESLKGSYIPVLRQRSRSMMDLKSLDAAAAKPGEAAKSRLPKLLPMFDVVFLMPDQTKND